MGTAFSVPGAMTLYLHSRQQARYEPWGARYTRCEHQTRRSFVLRKAAYETPYGRRARAVYALVWT
jgi:hypothetical protein